MPPTRRHSSTRASRYSADPQADSESRAGPLAHIAAWLCKLHELKREHQFLGRFSIEKLEAFHHYQAHAPWWRVMLVLAATPLPTLLVLVAMDVVPMADPRAGASRNAVCFVRSVLSHGVMTAVCLLPARQALRLNDSGHYSGWKITLIGLLTCLAIESVWIPLAFLWRFPVPFRELLGMPLWCAVVVLLHRWLAPRVFSQRPRRTRTYLLLVSMQIAILYGFLALSLAFAHAPTAVQVVMIACFPFVKVAVKRFLWTYARQLEDISTDVTVCMVEISGALYQTVCLQSAHSQLIGAAILVTDVAQALVEVRAYLGTEYLVDGRATLATAMAILRSSVYPGADERPSPALPSSTTSQADSPSASRRQSAAGTASNRRRPLVGSVFMPPKMLHLHASKRLLDLHRVDSNLIELIPQQDTGAGHDAAENPSFQDQHLELVDMHSIPSRCNATEGVDHSLTPPIRVASISTELGISPQRRTAPGVLTVVFKSSSRVSAKLPRCGGVFKWFAKRHASKVGMPSLTSGRSLSRVVPTKSQLSSRPPPPLNAPPSTVRCASFPSARPFEPPIQPRRTDSHHVGGTPVVIDGVQVSRRDQARILEQTLQLLFACEVLLFVEYMEVVMPVLYALAVGTVWALPNGRYNLITLSMDNRAMVSTIGSSVLYASCELASLVVLHAVVWQKYGVSAVHLLAFVLETYALTHQGKLVGAFIVIVNAATLHQGVDFTFRFDYDALLGPG